MLAVSCGAQPLTPPSKGGDPWLELRSEHFSLLTDLDDRQANLAVASLEETYALLGSAIFAGASVPSFGTQAIIFRQYQDLKQFVGDDVGGQYMPTLYNDLEASPTVLASGSLSLFARILFTHELAHRFNHVALGPTPIWLNEGLAQYYSTIRGGTDGPVLGETDPRLMCASGGVWQHVGDIICNYQVLRGSSLPKASELVAFDRQDFYADEPDQNGMIAFEQKEKRKQHYGAAWLFVHMLMHEKSAYGARFRELLQQPDGSSRKGAALANLVASVPAPQLDRDFQAYLQKTIPWRQQHPSSPKPLAQVKRRVLSESEIFISWARLDPFNGDSSARALAHLQAASKSSAPGDGQSYFWLGRYSALRDDPGEAELSYRMALEREPNNPDYLLGLLHLAWRGNGEAWLEAAKSEKVVAIIDALSRSARSAAQHNAVAAHKLLLGDAAGALESSSRACKLSSDCWECFHNYAATTYASGDAQQATELQRQALTRLPEYASASFAAQLAHALSFYERAARDPSSVESEPRPGLIAP